MSRGGNDVGLHLERTHRVAVMNTNDTLEGERGQVPSIRKGERTGTIILLQDRKGELKPEDQCLFKKKGIIASPE